MKQWALLTRGIQERVPITHLAGMIGVHRNTVPRLIDRYDALRAARDLARIRAAILALESKRTRILQQIQILRRQEEIWMAIVARQDPALISESDE
jgi:GAF domain-containing protein